MMTLYPTLMNNFILVPRLSIFVFITLCHHGLQIRPQLHKLISSSYPHLSIRVVFCIFFRLISFFPFKDRFSLALRSHVVYTYGFHCCGTFDVGQTRRHIHTRIYEHMGQYVAFSVSTISSLLSHITLLNTKSCHPISILFPRPLALQGSTYLLTYLLIRVY